jgi:type VI secretion system protein ImpG
MSDELLRYYNSELAYLREMGAEFAARYPSVAGRLALESDKCEDPHVERILEGVALLTARVRHKIDDEFPEITDALLGVLHPQLLCPVPSLTVVQFVLGQGQGNAREAVTLERGSQLRSRPIGRTSCRFRTVYPVTLWPIEVEAARLDPDRLVIDGKPQEAVALLQLTLRATGGATFARLPIDQLRFHLDGNGSLPYTLYELLLNHTVRVWVRGTAGDGRVVTSALPSGAIEPVGFGRGESLCGDEDPSTQGSRLLREYFAFPEKFLFFDLTGLDTIARLDVGAKVDVMIFLDAAPRDDVSVRAENFRVGCTPVVNLFAAFADPIALNHTQFEYRVTPNVDPPSAAEVYTIDSVTGSGGVDHPDPLVYEPFYSIRHGGRDDPSSASWYATRRPSSRKDDPGTDVDLAFVDPGFNSSLPACETVTVRLTCTNRDLPALLPFGGDEDVIELEGRAPVGRVRCLRKPSRPLRPPLGRSAQWRLISSLALNHLSLVDSERGLDALREVLAIHDVADTAVTRQQIAGISAVSNRRVPGRTGRAVALGVEVTVEFDEAHFVGGGIFLMASVLERFLGLHASVNAFSQLVATTRQREGVVKRWPPRSGERSLL